MYKVIGTRKTRAFRVLWLLEEIGLPYEHIPAAPASPQARQFNPTGKIPALVEGDSVVTDSVAIMTYLADKHDAFTAKAGSLARAEQDSAMLWLLDEMDAVLWAEAKYVSLYPEEMRVPQIAPVLEAEYGRSVKRLEKRLGDRPFLAGGSMSIADILAVHCLGWGVAKGYARPGKKLMDYSKRLRMRPAYKAAAALD